MEMTVGFPEMGSRFESVSFDPDLEIKMIKTVTTKITVCKLEQINALNRHGFNRHLRVI